MLVAIVCVLIAGFVVAVVGVGIYMGARDSAVDPQTGMSSAQARAAKQAQVICPHCHTRGSVTWAEVKRKQGISGAKATGAVLTGGVSVVATGLARKGYVRACSCRNCGMKWDVA